MYHEDDKRGLMKKIIVVCAFSLFALISQGLARGFEGKDFDANENYFSDGNIGGGWDFLDAPPDRQLPWGSSAKSQVAPPAPQTVTSFLPIEADEDLVLRQTTLKEKIGLNYDRFLAEDVNLWDASGLTHNTVKYLDFLVKVLRLVTTPGAAEDVVADIQGILRGALEGLPELTIEEKERKAGPSQVSRDRETIIRAFLATNIIRNLSGEGTYRTEDPRFDIEEPPLWVAMNAGIQKSPDQLYILTALSLAAQEQLWNPPSELKNLQAHVRDFWPASLLSRGDLIKRDRIIEQYINADLMNWTREMERLFPVCDQDRAILRDIQAQRPGMIVTKVNDVRRLGAFLKVGEVLVHFPSSGNENQCGFFSTFGEDNRDRGGLSARQESFSLVSRNLANPFVAKVFVDKIVDPHSSIRMSLGLTWKSYIEGKAVPTREELLEFINKGKLIKKKDLLKLSGQLESSSQDESSVLVKLINLDNLVPYEKQLKDAAYGELKARVLDVIVRLLQGYIGESQPLRREVGSYTDESSHEFSTLNLTTAAKIRLQVAQLVQYLFTALGAEPFQTDIEKMRKTLERDFARPSPGQTVVDTNVELTFRQAGSVESPLTVDYSYSDPVDGLAALSNQNIFGWVGDYVFKRNFYGAGATLANFKKFVEGMVFWLRLTSAEQKGRDAELRRLDELLNVWVLDNLNGKKTDDVTESIYQGIDFLRLNGANKRLIKNILEHIEFINYRLNWWRNVVVTQTAPKHGAKKLETVMKLNEEINHCLEVNDLVNFGLRLTAAITSVPDLLPDAFPNAQAWFNETGPGLQKHIPELLGFIAQFRDVLSEEKKRNAQIVPSAERQALGERLFNLVLRAEGASGLDRAFPTIVGSDRGERERIIEGLGLGKAVLEATRATGFPEGKDPVRDRGTAVWHLNQLRQNLVRYTVPLAVAEAAGSHFYLIDTILATDLEGKNTARNTHLINFGGYHYEKLIPTSALSLTSVAKADRHMVKYAGRLSDGGHYLAPQATLQDTLHASQKSLVSEGKDREAAGEKDKEGKGKPAGAEKADAVAASAPSVPGNGMPAVANPSAPQPPPAVVGEGSATGSSGEEPGEEAEMDHEQLAAALALSLGQQPAPAAAAPPA